MTQIMPVRNWRDNPNPVARLRSGFGADFDRLFDDWFLPPAQNTRTAGEFMPSCDIEEAENHYLMTMEVPGIPKDDIKVEVFGNRLTISGERKSEEKRNDKLGLHAERRFGKFRRSFEFPDGTDLEKVEADYRDGILRLVIPKIEKAKPKEIKITQGAPSGFFERFLRHGKEEKNRDSHEKPENAA